MALQAIITAGGKLPRSLRQEGRPTTKALLELNGISLLTTACQAAFATSDLARVAVVGDGEVANALPAGADYVAAGETVVENIFRGFKHLGGDSHDYLIISPDLPFLTSTVLAELQGKATGNCELGVPWVSREDFLGLFPGAPNRFEQVDRRKMTMGSVLYSTGPMIRRNIPLWRDLYNSRKHPHRLAIMLGLPILLSFIFKTTRLAKLETRLSTLCDGPVRAIQMRDASIAYDIDNKLNYDYALDHLRATR